MAWSEELRLKVQILGWLCGVGAWGDGAHGLRKNKQGLGFRGSKFRGLELWGLGLRV